MGLYKLDKLCYSYNKDKLALNSCSLGIKEGEAIGIIGPNGAGKSTLLKILAGVLFPDSGIITVDGKKIKKKERSLLKNKSGYLFQNPDDQLFCSTIYDDVAFGPIHQGIKGRKLDELVEKTLNRVGLLSLKDRPPYTLSGGEKRSAALACVLSMKPEILLMDESSAHLDPRSRRNLINLLNDLNQIKLIVSHDLDFILDTCQRVLVLNNGKIICDDLAENVLNDKALLESNGLELPLFIQGQRSK